MSVGETGVKRNGENIGEWRAPAPMIRKFRERGAWRWKIAEHIWALDGGIKEVQGARAEEALNGAMADINNFKIINKINYIPPIIPSLQRPTMTIQLKKLQSPTPILTDWDNAVAGPTDVPPTHIASLPSPPTAWLSARDMKVFGSTPLKEQIGIVRCKQCDRPVLRTAFADHYGMLYHLSIYQTAVLTPLG